VCSRDRIEQFGTFPETRTAIHHHLCETTTLRFISGGIITKAEAK
jgi:hypothetical protein